MVKQAYALNASHTLNWLIINSTLPPTKEELAAIFATDKKETK